jgi:hypothetical protein
MKTTITIIREVEIEVDARYIPAVRATPLTPPEPADVEIIDAYDDAGSIILTQSERQEIREMVLQDPPQRDPSHQ